jgi:hypothetical protein
MRGIGYLVIEIVLLLIASGIIGYLVGRVLHRRPRGGGVGSSDAGAETRALALEGRLSETQQELEDVKRQLTMERLRARGE